MDKKEMDKKEKKIPEQAKPEQEMDKKEAFTALIERYAKQNPVKFEMKKEALAKQLAAL